MNVNSNSYTIGFACVMVVLVAALLASTSIKLTPRQDRNIELEKKQNILQSVGVYVDRDASESSYSQFIKEELILDNKGNIFYLSGHYLHKISSEGKIIWSIPAEYHAEGNGLAIGADKSIYFQCGNFICGVR